MCIRDSLTPGFIDCHVHVLGGGGEGGFANRTPEATMEGLTKFGVTTVVGCLGTDGIGRDMCALVAKTKGLNEQGISAYCYTGSYQVPVRTLTDSIPKAVSYTHLDVYKRQVSSRTLPTFAPQFSFTPACAIV